MRIEARRHERNDLIDDDRHGQDGAQREADFEKDADRVGRADGHGLCAGLSERPQDELQQRADEEHGEASANHQRADDPDQPRAQLTEMVHERHAAFVDWVVCGMNLAQRCSSAEAAAFGSAAFCLGAGAVPLAAGGCFRACVRVAVGRFDRLAFRGRQDHVLRCIRRFSFAARRIRRRVTGLGRQHRVFFAGKWRRGILGDSGRGGRALGRVAGSGRLGGRRRLCRWFGRAGREVGVLLGSSASLMMRRGLISSSILISSLNCDWNSLQISRSWRIYLATSRMAPGSRSGPSTTRAMTAIMTSSKMPMPKKLSMLRKASAEPRPAPNRARR